MDSLRAKVTCHEDAVFLDLDEGGFLFPQSHLSSFVEPCFNGSIKKIKETYAAHFNAEKPQYLQGASAKKEEVLSHETSPIGRQRCSSPFLHGKGAEESPLLRVSTRNGAIASRERPKTQEFSFFRDKLARSPSKTKKKESINLRKVGPLHESESGGFDEESESPVKGFLEKKEKRPLKYTYSSREMKRAAKSILNELHRAFVESIVRHLPREPVFNEKKGIEISSLIKEIQSRNKADQSFLSVFARSQMFEVFLLEFYRI